MFDLCVRLLSACAAVGLRIGEAFVSMLAFLHPPSFTPNSIPPYKKVFFFLRSFRLAQSEGVNGEG